MLCEVSRICNDAAPLSDTTTRVLRRVCSFNGWYAACVHVATRVQRFQRELQYISESAPEDARTSLEEMQSVLRDEVKASGEAVWQRTEFSSKGGRAYTAMCAPIRTNGTVLGVMTLLSDSRPPPSDDIRGAVEAVAMQLAGVLERKHLDLTIAEATNEEQLRIGRDLHDSVNQELSAAALLGDTIADRLERVGSADADVARRISAGIRRAMGSVRDIVEGLVPVELDRQGLEAAIERMADTADERSGISVRVRGDAPQMEAKVSRELLMIATEAVRNAVLHAAAANIGVSWSETTLDGADAIRLEITDDGSGLAQNDGYESGRGLSIMRHRATVIDGSLEILQNENGGTTIRCVVPLPHDAEGDEKEG